MSMRENFRSLRQTPSEQCIEVPIAGASQRAQGFDNCCRLVQLETSAGDFQHHDIQQLSEWIQLPQ